MPSCPHSSAEPPRLRPALACAAHHQVNIRGVVGELILTVYHVSEQPYALRLLRRRQLGEVLCKFSGVDVPGGVREEGRRRRRLGGRQLCESTLIESCTLWTICRGELLRAGTLLTTTTSPSLRPPPSYPPPPPTPTQ